MLLSRSQTCEKVHRKTKDLEKGERLQGPVEPASPTMGSIEGALGNIRKHWDHQGIICREASSDNLGAPWVWRKESCHTLPYAVCAGSLKSDWSCRWRLLHGYTVTPIVLAKGEAGRPPPNPVCWNLDQSGQAMDVAKLGRHCNSSVVTALLLDRCAKSTGRLGELMRHPGSRWSPPPIGG